MSSQTMKDEVRIEPAESSSKSKVEKVCAVCGDRALGYNFNAITCESCKAFFRRNALKNKEFQCPFRDECSMDHITRRFCQKCRLRKCLDVGMKKEWILSEEDRAAKRRKIEENRKKKQQDNGEDEEINTSSSPRTLSTSPHTLSTSPTYPHHTPSTLSTSLTYPHHTPSTLSTSPTYPHHTPSTLSTSPTYPHHTPSTLSTLPPNLQCTMPTSHSYSPSLSTSHTYAPNTPSTTISTADTTSLALAHIPSLSPFTANFSNTVSNLITTAISSQSPSPHPPPPSSLAALEVDTPSLPSNKESDPCSSSPPRSLRQLIAAPIIKPDLVQLMPEEREKIGELHKADECMTETPDDWKKIDNPELVDVVNMTDNAVRRMIKMAKRISGFKQLSTDDQIALLKSGTTELMILRSVMSYDFDKDCWPIPKNHVTMSVLKKAKDNNVYNMHLNYMRSFDDTLRQDASVMLLLTAIVLFDPSRANVKCANGVIEERERYQQLLWRYLHSRYPPHIAYNHYTHLKDRLAALHDLHDNHLKVFLDVNPGEVKPLIIELFDLKKH